MHRGIDGNSILTAEELGGTYNLGKCPKKPKSVIDWSMVQSITARQYSYPSTVAAVLSRMKYRFLRGMVGFHPPKQVFLPRVK